MLFFSPFVSSSGPARKKNLFSHNAAEDFREPLCKEFKTVCNFIVIWEKFQDLQIHLEKQPSQYGGKKKRNELKLLN